MNRMAIDRLTDTRAFRVALLLAALPVWPVLAVGALTTLIAAPALLIEGAPIDLEHAVFALLSAGGVLGAVGYLRAHAAVRAPQRHNVTATLICLAAGVLAALAVASFAVAGVVGAWSRAPTTAAGIVLGVLFAAATLVWAMSGVAWMQRLRYGYAERTGHVFDELPALLLFVTIALATAAALMTVTL